MLQLQLSPSQETGQSKAFTDSEMHPPGTAVTEPLRPFLSALTCGLYLPTGQAGRGGTTDFTPILISIRDQRS